jgi:type I restriction enzyme S subunit
MKGKTKTTATKEEAKPALVPKLRFPEFRDGPSWTGKPMGKVYEFKSNNSLSRDQLNYDAGTVKNIHYGDIHTKFSTLFDITKERVPFINSSESLDGFRPENDCVEGDMIFADASEDLADIGKSIEIVRLNGERVVSGQHTILARPNGDSLIVGFGAYLFKSSHVRAQIQKESQGSKVLGISATRLTKIELPIPSTKPEQQKIAECLSSVDELMAAQARKVDALTTHKKGLMQQLFPCEGETQPRLRFPEFQDAGEWEESTVDGLVVTVTPPKKLPTSDYQAEGEFPIVDQSQDYICGWSNDGEAVIDEGLPVIVFGDHTCALKLIDRPFVQGADGIKILRPKRGIDTRFLFCALEADPVVQEGYKRHFSILKEKKLLYPDPESGEQERIASCLSSLDALITAETQKHEALKSHKKGLMQQLFPSPEEVEA